MKFLIITHAKHKLTENKIFAYEPYVREMNLWVKNVSEVKILAPLSNESVGNIDAYYQFSKIKLTKISSFDVLTLKNKFIAFTKIPIILYQIMKACFWADHIHLRCPGNIGLLGCIVQIFFPFTKKTVKYAGNWDPNSKQPFSYRVQKWIVSNTFLTKNCKVLVYGNWENQTKNIVPFFTASYIKSEIVEIPKKELDGKINFIYVGAFTKSKQPLLSVKVIQKLLHLGYNVSLNMYGNGAQFEVVKTFVKKNNLKNSIFIHGNQSKETVKEAFKKTHFLIFISKSEGWPKVVAEAMFWSCLPISSKVSCVPYMLAYGKRGAIVNSNENEITSIIEKYLSQPKKYYLAIENARKWSQNYTLDKFSQEIKKLLIN